MPKYDVIGNEYESPAEFGAYHAANRRPWAAATPQRPAPIGQVSEMGRQQNLSSGPLAQQAKKEEPVHTQMQQQQQQFRQQQQHPRMDTQMGGQVIPVQFGANDAHVRQFHRSEPALQLGGNDVAVPQPDFKTSRAPVRRVEQQQSQRYRVVQCG